MEKALLVVLVVVTHYRGGEEKTYEKMGGEIFLKLVETGCIEAVNKKHRLVADTYKMNPFIRSAMIEFAKEARFFDFDKKGNPTADFSNCHRACLALNDPSQKLLRTGSRSDGSPLDHEKLQTIFNVNEPYPDFFKLEWFSKLKNVKVLYLGRWKNSASHHIEVESGEFLKGLRSMKFLRFFSLQGISRITKLPDSVCKLSSLRILDLRACHNLELLPDGIGSLKQLTHLDISECYLLEYIPKGIALLSELLVLKGFVVGDRISADSCTLGELLKLSKLRKLSIYTNVEDFPTDVEVSTIRQVKKLQKLTIVWGGGVDRHAKQLTKSTFSEGRHPAGCCHLRERKCFTRKLLKAATFKQGLRPEIPEEFKELEKLDLQCYPKMTAPSWLIPDKLAKLKKLYIRGGELQNLGQFKKNDKWKVEILRLKFLSNLKMDWNEIRASFPDLFYLEKFNCPKLTLFPCDENGLWLKPLNDR